MATVKNPFNNDTTFVHMGSDEEAAEIAGFVAARGAFSTEYARRQGWIGPNEELDPEKLSWEQILEIRAQPEWKAAGI